MILNDALKIYLGARQVNKFYLGGEAPPITEYIPCGGNTTYTGNIALPAVYSVVLGNDTGVVSLSYNAQGIPDRFVVEFDGLTAIDTGYVGLSTYQTQLNNYFGTTTPIVGPPQGIATFNKNTSTSTAMVKVFAPLPGTAWTFTLGCPE
jgi:hypothetical protein